MHLTLLDNGLHSLELGYTSLTRYEEMLYLKRSSKKARYFQLKSAIIYIQHGIEILIKFYLQQQNELLLFTQIDEPLKKAFKEKNELKLKSVFQTSLKNKIHTVNYKEALSRFETICNNSLKDDLRVKLYELGNLRNLITHSEIFANEETITEIFEGLIDSIDFLFHSTIGKKYKTLSTYSSLLKKYKEYQAFLEKNKLEDKKESIDFFLSLFKKISLVIGANEVKRITDINKATMFFSSLSEFQLNIGADFYNEHKAPIIRTIKRIDSERFAIFSEGNNAEYILKFKSIIFFMPDIQSTMSPLIFIEADKDVNDIEGAIVENDYEIGFIRGVGIKKTGLKIFDKKKLSVFFKEYDDEPEFHPDYGFPIPGYYSIFKFLTKGIACFINVAGLHWGGARDIVFNSHQIDGKKLEVILRQQLTNEKSTK